MGRLATYLVVVAFLIGIGVSVGKAQESPTSITFVIDAPVGDTIIQCDQGCEFYSMRQGRPTASSQLTFSCTPEGGRQRCVGRFGVGAIGRPFGSK